MVDKAKTLPDHDADTLFATKDIAEILGMTHRVVNKWCQEGRLKYSLVGNTHVIYWRDFVMFWDSYKGPRKRELVAAKVPNG